MDSSEEEEEEVGEAPRFKTPLKPQHAQIGKETKLECVVFAKPAPEVHWYKGDNEIGKPTPDVPAPKEKAEYNPETGLATLTITEVNEEDLTIFKVRAVNKFGRAECRANIVERHAPMVETREVLMAPKITKPLEAKLVRVKETVTLEARFEGKPTPTVKWYRNGKEINVGRSEMKVIVEEGVTTLEIPEMFKEDGGKYEVRAMNEVGEARSSGTVAVTEPQQPEMAEVRPPRFIKQLQPQMVPEGEVVIMEAQVDSHPTSSFQWFLHSIPVQSSHDLRITTEENRSIMVIDEALSEHAGHVTVRAENVAGSVTSMATLAILPEYVTETVEELAAPVFPRPLQANLRVMDGEEVCLTCKVTGKPTPKVMWFHDGKPVKQGKDVTIFQDTEGVCKLAITEIFPEDAGQYTCRAINRVGETVCATSLVVEAYEYIPDSEIASVTVGTSLTTGQSGSEEDLLAEKETLSEVSEEDAELPDSEVGTAPVFTTKLPSVFHATEKEMARLETKITGEPKPKIRWYKKGKKIKPTKAMQIENMEDGTSVLTISEVSPKDAGPILCEGQNRLGMDTTTTEFIVEEHLESKAYKKPEWVTKMEEMKAKLQGKVEALNSSASMRVSMSEHVELVPVNEVFVKRHVSQTKEELPTFGKTYVSHSSELNRSGGAMCASSTKKITKHSLIADSLPSVIISSSPDPPSEIQNSETLVESLLSVVSTDSSTDSAHSIINEYLHNHRKSISAAIEALNSNENAGQSLAEASPKSLLSNFYEKDSICRDPCEESGSKEIKCIEMKRNENVSNIEKCEGFSHFGKKPFLGFNQNLSGNVLHITEHIDKVVDVYVKEGKEISSSENLTKRSYSKEFDIGKPLPVRERSQSTSFESEHTGLIGREKDQSSLDQSMNFHMRQASEKVLGGKTELFSGSSSLSSLPTSHTSGSSVFSTSTAIYRAPKSKIPVLARPNSPIMSRSQRSLVESFPDSSIGHTFLHTSASLPLRSECSSRHLFPLEPREVDPGSFTQLHTADSMEELQEFLLFESHCMTEREGVGGMGGDSGGHLETRTGRVRRVKGGILFSGSDVDDAGSTSPIPQEDSYALSDH